MMYKLRLATLSSCLWASMAAAQVYTAGTLEFFDPGPYTHDQLESAAAIHPGAKFTADDLGASAQRLVDTGYFDDVAASLQGKYAAMTITYQLKPTPQTSMLHVGFENLVWLTPEEILAAIRTKSPLFEGYLPEGSPNQDLLKAALTEALAAKGIPATVEYQTVEPTLAHPVREIEFRVTKPEVRVANVKLSGVSQDLVPYVQKSVNTTARKPYLAVPPGLATADQILAPLLDAGYIQAYLTNVQVTDSPQPNGTTGVVLSGVLDAGDVYKVSGISYAGMPLLSADEFTASAKLHPGEIASRAALLQTLEPLDKAYRRQGYMDVTIVAAPTFHKETHEVSYAVSVSPGEPYRVKDLSAVNLDPAASAAFDAKFQMKAGAVFNPEYLSEFLRDNKAVPEFQNLDANYTAYAHPKTHTVDVDIVFRRK